MSDRSTLERFYELLDDGAGSEELLSLVHPDLVFEISLPGRTIAGGLPEFRAFLEHRMGQPTTGRHDLLSSATSGQFDHLTGQLITGDGLPVLFFATARRGANNSIESFFMRRSEMSPLS